MTLRPGRVQSHFQASRYVGGLCSSPPRLVDATRPRWPRGHPAPLGLERGHPVTTRIGSNGTQHGCGHATSGQEVVARDQATQR